MKIKIKELINFHTFSDLRKRNFIERISRPQVNRKEPERSGGGDYWVRCISAINAACRENDNSFIEQKIQDITNDKQNASRLTNLKYDRNIAILNNFLHFDFSDLFPEEYSILSNTIKEGEIRLQNFEIKVKIHHPFFFEEDGVRKIGALLFVARSERYSRSELGLFAQLIYEFLSANYSDDYSISTSNIIIIDAMTTDSVSYSMIESGEISSQLNVSLNEIQNLLQN